MYNFKGVTRINGTHFGLGDVKRVLGIRTTYYFFFHFLSPLDIQSFIPPELEWLGPKSSYQKTSVPQC